MLTGQYADWFVGGVSGLLGLVILVTLASHPERVFELAKVRFLQHLLGRTAATVFLYALAIALIVLGVAIGCGWKIHWKEDRKAVSQRANTPNANSPRQVVARHCLACEPPGVV